MGKKVLLADDSATIQKLVEMALSETDFELKAVSNGKQAVESFASFRPDVILADAIMPHMDGYEVCAHVKQTPELADVPVVLLTGRFQPFDEARAQEAAIDKRLVKPFSQEQLVALIEELAGGSAAPAEAPEPAAAEPPMAEPPMPPISGDETVQFRPEELTANAQTMADMNVDAPSLSDFDLEEETEEEPAGNLDETQPTAEPLETDEADDITLDLSTEDLDETETLLEDESALSADDLEEVGEEEPLDELSVEDLEEVAEPIEEDDSLAGELADDELEAVDEGPDQALDQPIAEEDLEPVGALEEDALEPEPLSDDDLALDFEPVHAETDPLEPASEPADETDDLEVVEIDEPLFTDEAGEALDTEPVDDPLTETALAEEGEDIDTEPVAAPPMDVSDLEEPDWEEPPPGEDDLTLEEDIEPWSADEEDAPSELDGEEQLALVSEDAPMLSFDEGEAETEPANPAAEAELAATPASPEPNGSDAAEAPPLTEEQLNVLADRVAEKVIAKLGSTAVRDIAWNVVPELAEAMIKKRIYELEQAVDAE